MYSDKEFNKDLDKYMSRHIWGGFAGLVFGGALSFYFLNNEIEPTQTGLDMVLGTAITGIIVAICMAVSMGLANKDLRAKYPAPRLHSEHTQDPKN